MVGLRLRDNSSNSDSDSQGAFSTPPLTQSYRALAPSPAPPPAPAPVPAAGEPQPVDTDSLGRLVIVPDGSAFHMGKEAENHLRESIRRLYDRPYSSWTKIPHQTLCTWLPQHDKRIATNYERKSSSRMSDWFRDARLKNKRSAWMLPHLFEALQEYWETLEFKAKCEQVKKARSEGNGSSLHIGGAKSQGMIARELAKKLGRDPTQEELFRATHVKKKKNESDADTWVEQRAEQAYMDYQRLLSEYSQTQEALGGPTQPQPDIATQIWTEKWLGGGKRREFTT